MLGLILPSSSRPRLRASRRASTAAFAVAFLLAFGAADARAQSAQESGYSGDTLVLQGGNGEYFVGGLPAGWRQLPGSDRELVSERLWVPQDQSQETFTDSIIFQSLPQLAGVTPTQFFTNFAQEYRGRCPALLATEFKPAEFGNGFEDVSVILACPENKENATGEVTLFRGISGASAFYLIQRGWRLAPFTADKIPVSGQQFDAATKAVEFGYACDVGSQARPCPDGWDGVLTGLDKSSPAVVFPAGS